MQVKRIGQFLIFYGALCASSSSAHAHQLSREQRAHVGALGQELGRCHRRATLPYVRTELTVDQIIDRALAACAAREGPIRNALTRHLGRARAQEVLRGQRRHWRDMIGRVVLEERARQ